MHSHVVAALREAGLAIDRIARVMPVAGVHRNLVWRVELDDSSLMLKLQARLDDTATVAHEVEVLRRLQPFAGVPRVVAAGRVGQPGRPFMLTEVMPGLPLARWLCRDAPAAAGQLAGYAEWLHAFSLVDAANPLLRRKASGFGGPWSMTYSPGADGPDRVSLVHGSFDPKNVLVSDDGGARLSGVVDFEATRLGPPLIDIAGLALHFLMWRRADLASAWLTAAAQVWTWPSLAEDAMPYLLAQHERRCAAAAVEPRVNTASPQLISGLLATVRAGCTSR